MKKGLYSGSFDPITNGHLDIIVRAARLFDELFVLVATNPHKNYFFNEDTRFKMVEEATKNVTNVKVFTSSNLTINFALDNHISFLIRSIRNNEDYSYENKLNFFNFELAKNVDTIYFFAKEKYRHISSSAIKEMALLGTCIKKYVPDYVCEVLSKVKK